MNRASFAASVAFAGLALLGVNLANATTVQKFTWKELARKSPTIVLATVEDEYSRWDTGNKEIYTYVTLRVNEPIKGAKSDVATKGPKNESTITIRQLGGTVDNITSIVPGMPRFTRGEQVVVFLSANDDAGYPWVMGLQQGKYTVVTDKNGAKQVRNDVDGLTRISPDGSRSEASVSDKMPLNAFLYGIKTELDEAGKFTVDPTTPTE
jgi:hypothetical protein